MCWWEIRGEQINGYAMTVFQQMADRGMDISEEQYRRVRDRLITFFRMNGSYDPEALADEVVYRTLRRIEDGIQIDCELSLFCLGVARNVLRESRKKQEFQEITHDPSDSTARRFGNLSRVEQVILLNDCLQILPQEKRRVLLEYHMGDREKLARDRNQTANALRIEVHRSMKDILSSVRRSATGGRPQ
jgi:DNA-directed RNA polymerase specialized sigma24 family protein